MPSTEGYGFIRVKNKAYNEINPQPKEIHMLKKTIIGLATAAVLSLIASFIVKSVTQD